MPNPFALLRQALSTGKFDDSDTRNSMMELIDSLERDLDSSPIDYSELEATQHSAINLQRHLIVLLNEEEELENAASSKKPSIIRTGEIEDDAEERD